jgi:hypothetical protein
MAAPLVDRLLRETLQQLADVPASDVLGVPEEVVELRDIVDGSVAGSTNDAVLRFNSANDNVVPASGGMVVTHDATDGDSVLISKRGVYEVSFTFSAAASDEVRLGVSANVAAGGLTGDPAMTIAGMLDVGGGLLPAATTAYWKVGATLRVTESQAKAGVTVRAHGTDAAGGVIPDAAIDQNTDCHLRITRVADLVA